MNLLALKYFIAITEYSSFTKAAEHLYVTQPTLSRQIADLEEEFGVPLFVRSKRSLTLTPAGQICLEEAKEIVSRCDRLTERLKYAEHDVTGALSIGYLGGIEHDLLTEPLRVLGADYPGLNIGLNRASLAELNHFLLSGKFDVIYTVATGLETVPGVSYTKIAKNILQLVVPRTHPLARKNAVSVRELANEHFVLFERNSTPLTVDSVIEMCLRSGFSPSVVYYARDPHTLMLMVSSGKGVAFLSSRMKVSAPEGVKFLDLVDCDLDFDLVLAYKTADQNPLIPLLVEKCTELYQRSNPM